MARKGREISSTGIYHVLLRGENQLFLTEEDYEQFYRLLQKYFEEGPLLFGYCMDRQTVHLLVKESGGGGGLSAVIKPLTTSYARYFNRVHGQAGKLFYDRYQSEPVESGQELLGRLTYFYFLPECYGKSARSSREEAMQDGGVIAMEELLRFAGGQTAYGAAEAAMPKRLYLDDYVHMPDETLAKILRRLCGCRSLNSKVLAQHREVWEGVVSSRRLHQLLGETVPAGKKKEAPAQPEKPAGPPVQPPAEPAQKPRQKQQLSVWLL